MNYGVQKRGKDKILPKKFLFILGLSPSFCCFMTDLIAFTLLTPKMIIFKAWRSLWYKSVFGETPNNSSLR